MTQELFISVDVETSGPIPGKYSLLAIGACVVSEPQQTFYAELRPLNDAFVPEAMQTIKRTLDDFQRSGLEPVQAMQDFKRWVEGVRSTCDPVFVGFNAVFDWSFINWYFHTYLDDNPFGFGGIDIKSYYMGLAGCDWAATRSSRIPARYKGDSAHTHNALDDALEQAEMFRRMRA